MGPAPAEGRGRRGASGVSRRRHVAEPAGGSPAGSTLRSVAGAARSPPATQLLPPPEGACKWPGQTLPGGARSPREAGATRRRLCCSRAAPSRPTRRPRRRRGPLAASSPPAGSSAGLRAGRGPGGWARAFAAASGGLGGAGIPLRPRPGGAGGGEAAAGPGGGRDAGRLGPSAGAPGPGAGGGGQEDAARLPSDDGGESGCDEHGAQCGGGCDPPAPALPLQRSLWAQERCCPPLAALPVLGDRQAQGDAGVRSCSEAGPFPWGEDESPAWAHPFPCRICGAGAADRSRWCPTEQAVSGTSRTLSHPSFQSFFTATASSRASSCLPGVGGHVSSSGSGSSVGRLPLLDCSSFYYTDPTLPPGLRIYNWLSDSSQEVCRSRPLNTPAPIMAVREVSPPPRRPCAGSQRLSDLERQAILALLELPTSTRQDSPASPGAVAGQE